MATELAGFQHIYIQKESPRTLLLLHGTGGNEQDLIPLAEALDPSASVLSPRGTVLENGMPRFFKRLAEGVFDYDDLRQKTKDLVSFITTAQKTYGFSQDQVVAVGYSNGANIALHLMATEPSVVRSAILFRPMAAALPETLADMRACRMCILAGMFDPLVSQTDAQTVEQKLKDHGAGVTLHLVPQAHALSADDVQYAQTWLKGLGRS